MKEKINIVVLAPYRIYPAVSGGQKCTALLYKYLSEILPLTMISVDSNDPPDTRNITLVRMLGNTTIRYINPLLFFRLRRFIKGQDITHLIIEHPYLGWAAWLLKITTPIQFIVHSHNIEGLRFKNLKKWWWRILYNYEKWVHRRADTSFFITEEDMSYAVSRFTLQKEKCRLVTYGTELTAIPADAERKAAKKIISEKHAIENGVTILLFNGMLDYQPNLAAVNTILEEINPLLLVNKRFAYKIIICGKGLPPAYDNLSAYADRNIIYTGFVNDISLYFKGADIFMNAVNEGGGIKTKLVEALGYNLNAVSTQTGAVGIPGKLTGGKLTVVADNDAAAFYEAIVNAEIGRDTPGKFFDWFYWGNIAQRTASVLNPSTK